MNIKKLYMSIFEYEKTEILIDRKILDLYLINIIIQEYRKDETIFYSSNKMYTQMGYIFNNSFHLLKNYMKCINCYANYENDIKCKYCNYEYSENKHCFFLNIREILPSNIYSILKELYTLEYVYNYYYDQRHSMNRFLKEELAVNALHPDRIEKILKLTNDTWINLDKYV